jgi:hypothetical protein
MKLYTWPSLLFPIAPPHVHLQFAWISFFVAIHPLAGSYWTPVILGGFTDSLILTTQSLINPLVARLGSRWTLCYRGTRDTNSVWAYKQQCGYMGQSFISCAHSFSGPTLTVFRAGTRVFGAYAEVAWTNHQQYVRSPTSFLFRYPAAMYSISYQIQSDDERLRNGSQLWSPGTCRPHSLFSCVSGLRTAPISPFYK